MESTHIVDYMVFKQTAEQKKQAKVAKQNWKADMWVFYGEPNWRKQNNYPHKLKD